MPYFVNWSRASDKHPLQQAQFDELETAKTAARKIATDLADHEGEAVEALVTNEAAERLMCHVQG